MTSVASPAAFLDRLPVFAEFGRIADTTAYVPLPDGWIVGIADVVSSTRAIEQGQYKAVNMAGAAVIASVSNALDENRFPFAFGGDGASFAVPPDWAAAAREALAATATFVSEEFDLDLRIAEIPIEAIRAAGHDVTVARFAPSANLSYAMFAGGGLAWGEERMKAGQFLLPKASAGTRPDLNGLSCRFDETPSQRGTVLSLIVRPAAASVPEHYAALVRDILQLVETSPDMARPIPEGGPPLGWPAAGLEFEVRSSLPPGTSLWRHRLRLLVRSAFAAMVFRLRIPIGRFDPRQYLEQLVANTDYRKYDDGLRMTVDCSLDLADAIEARLAKAERDGVARSGVHRQSATLMTCITPSIHRSDHLHFVDGAAGGYASAAAKLKA